MTNFAYIRIDRLDEISIKSQELTIQEYAASHKINFEFYDGSQESNLTSNDLYLDCFISSLHVNDGVFVADIDSLCSGDAFGTFNNIMRIIRKGANLILCLSDTVICNEDSLDPEKFFSMLGKAYSSKKRSKKAKKICEQRKDNGKLNGRQRGEFLSSKLDKFEFEIIAALSSNLDKKTLANKYHVNRVTIYRWLENRDKARQLAKIQGIDASEIGEIKRLLRAKSRE